MQISDTPNSVEWRDVPGYEGLYAVSDSGQVKSLERFIHQATRWGGMVSRRWPEKLLAQTPDNGPYAYGRLQVKLSKDGKAKTHLVHRLVAAAFLGPCPDGCEVAHNDGDVSNNRVENLRYATPRENTHDKFMHGTVLRGSQIGNSKLTEEQAIAIKSANGRYQEIADRFGIAIAQVSRIKSGKRWGHLT